MKLDPNVAARTLDYLKRAIPRGQQEADELHSLIRFYEQVTLRRVTHR